MAKYKFKPNPTVTDLAMAFFPVLQEWCREEILKPVWNAVPEGEGFGRRENYPRVERSIQFDMKHSITITIDLEGAAEYIEEGRRAGKMPPVAAINRWCVVKRVMPRNNQTIAQRNYAICRAIGKKGTDPKKYLDNQITNTPLPWDKLEPVIDDYFNAFVLLEK